MLEVGRLFAGRAQARQGLETEGRAASSASLVEQQDPVVLKGLSYPAGFVVGPGCAKPWPPLEEDQHGLVSVVGGADGGHFPCPYLDLRTPGVRVIKRHLKAVIK